MTRRRPDAAAPRAPRTTSTRARSRHGLPWSTAELATLTRLATHRGRVRKALPWDSLTALLPGRTRRTITARLVKLTRAGVVHRGGRRWTTSEDATLLRTWPESAQRTLLDALPARSWAAILQRARVLGLETRVRDLVALPEAARRLGLSRAATVALAERSGVPLRHAPHADGRRRDRGPVKRLRAARRPRYVDLDALTEALEAELTRETVTVACARHGLQRGTLTRWLLADGVARVQLGREWTYAPADVDRVVAAHGWRPGTETVTEHARLRNLPPTTLVKWVRAAGHRGAGLRGPILLTHEEADAIVAAHRGGCRVRRPWEQTALAPFATPEACAERGVWCVCRRAAGVWSVVGRSVVKHDALSTARALLLAVDAPAHVDVALVSPEGVRVHVPRPRGAR